MIYVKMNKQGRPVEFRDGTLTAEEYRDKSWKGSWDYKSLEEVEGIALYVTAMAGCLYVAVDRGPFVSPRYGVTRCPAIGDKVSYGFNGDYYPDGEIVKITKKLTVTTSTGNTYRRRKQTAAWMRTGGTWGLVAGHIDERNPHF